MFKCVECGELFTEPKQWTETHGFTYGPYEEWIGSPCCYGGYEKVYECECCGEFTNDLYTDADGRYCWDCYKELEAEDEEE